MTPRARIRSRCAHGGSRSRPRARAHRRGRNPPPLGRILQLLLRVVQQAGDLAVLLLEVGQFGREILLRVAVGLLQWGKGGNLSLSLLLSSSNFLR